MHTFLVEEFIPHTDEYYVAIKTERDRDILYFSKMGGVDIEDHWNQVTEIIIPLSGSDSDTIFAQIQAISQNETITHFLIQLYTFFVEYGFVYLEINPFVIKENDEIVCLDMVAKVDSTEQFLQKQHWGNLDFPHPFGDEKTESEKYIDELDRGTGASLKLRILNPNGRIWLLTSGGGASVAIADTLADMGYTNEIANYGECSGNPDRANTRAYTETILKNMILSGRPNQYLIIAGAIANFTHIDQTFGGIIDALEVYQNELKNLGITLLVRRGGIHDKK